MARFLIVDDESVIRGMIKKYIDEMAHESDSCSNGEEALKALFETRYDGVFTDLRMPGMDGFALLEAMKEEGFTMPVTVVSAYAEPENIIRCFKLGAIDFITKPFSPDEIKDIVKEMLKHKLDMKETAQYIRGLIKQGAIKSAEEYLRKLFFSFPSSPIPNYLMGLKFLAEEDTQMAIRHLKASIALDDGYEPAKSKLLSIEEEGKNGEEG
ncbi:MAG TPA: response regulator [Thermotogota bacterium]|nr:response regulator [Thermotogota bacterium]HPJ88045.1 response regulator [Thermotogota bacterium]HPR96230.1 response regulator [Thermotogota bacterium]